LSGGSCFILRFDAGLIGVIITAEHVIGAFERDGTNVATIECLLRTVPFDLKCAIIDRDTELDIVTFRVTEDQLAKSEAVEIDCRRERWPPPMPDTGRELSLAGFPEVLRKVSPRGEMEFGAYVFLCRVEDVTRYDIITIHEPQRDIRVRAAPELTDLSANLSGCSGGPAMMHVERKGLWRWFPVGLFVKGPDEPRNFDPPREYDTIRLRRIDFVNADGSINHKNDGWLPTRRGAAGARTNDSNFSGANHRIAGK
jgi:hypothetical protein